jgi:hypothetical protein
MIQTTSDHADCPSRDQVVYERSIEILEAVEPDLARHRARRPAAPCF